MLRQRQRMAWPWNQGVAVVQGHWKWRRSIDHIRLCIGPPKIYGSGSAIRPAMRLRIATKTAYGTSFSFEKVTARPHEHVSVVKIWKQHINMRITWPHLSVLRDHSSNVIDVIYWFLTAANLLLTRRRKVTTTVFRRQNFRLRKRFLEIGLRSSVAVPH